MVRARLHMLPYLFAATILAVAMLALSAASHVKAATVTVFAAASTVDVMSAAAKLYESQTGHRVRLSVASSSTLARQIENGAPADIFLSANTKWMDYLDERNLIARSSRRALLNNRLVLISPKTNGQMQPDQMTTKSDSADIHAVLSSRLTPADRWVMGDPDHVPAGIYGQQALTKIGAWTDIRHRLARAQDTRSALMLVARGEVAVGLVYETDAFVSDRVDVLGRLPIDAHDPIVYPVALVAGARSSIAREFYDYLFGPECGRIFAASGFGRPDIP